MTFLQPHILWGLPLLLIPVVIHLINRLRHRPQPWGAMRFLRTATRSSISQAKLRQFLVLLFRVLAVLALIFFVSRPLAGGWLGWALSPAPEVVVLVLDRSASMEARAPGGKSSREQAIDLWTEALRQFEGASRLVLVDNGGERAQELPNVSALKESGFTGATDTRADVPALLQRAYAYLVDSRSGAAEIWIASDLQSSNWKAADGQWQKLHAQFGALPQKVRFRLLAFDAAPVNNISISLVDALRRTRQQHSELEVTLDLQQTQTRAEPVVLRSTINGVESEQNIDLSGQALRWRNVFSLGATTNGGWGSLSLAADANPRDNEVYFAYGPEQSAAALVVAENATAARPLRLAASDLSQEQAAWAKIAPPEDFAGQSLSNIALIVWSAPLPEGISADLLGQFANSGGAVIFFPSGAASANDFLGLGWGQTVAASSNQVFAVTKWNELDGPLARTEEGLGVPVRLLEIYQRAAISGPGTPLAWFEDGAPFLVRKLAAKGEVYFCAASAHPDWSALAEGPVLVPMLQRLLLNGSRRVNAGVLHSIEELRGSELQSWAPLGQGLLKADPQLIAGLYKTGDRVAAVNRSIEENDLLTLKPDEARKLFGNLNFQLHQEKGRGGDKLQGEVWRLFLFLMLAFLIVEGLLVLPPRPETAPATLPKPRQEALA